MWRKIFMSGMFRRALIKPFKRCGKFKRPWKRWFQRFVFIPRFWKRAFKRNPAIYVWNGVLDREIDWGDSIIRDKEIKKELLKLIELKFRHRD